MNDEANKQPIHEPEQQPHLSFKTPEQVANESATSDREDASLRQDEPNEHKGLTTKKIHKRLWEKFKKLPRRRKIVIIVIAVLVIGGIATAVILSTNKKPVPQAVIMKVVPKPQPKTTLVASDLTGLPVDPSVNQRPVTGIMIENSDQARPQSGLIDAGVVFEAIAEGGITRFLALYQDTQPSSIGPIRSLRPYYLGWDLGFDAPIAHVGGSADALSDVISWGAENLDEFANGAYYTRITSRQAPHNVYTSMAELNALETSKGYTSSKYTSFPRKADAPLKQPTASTVNLTLSSYDYSPSYTYNAATNSYNRDEDGVAFTDQVTGAQISPKVVIAIVVPLSQGALDASGAYYSDYAYLGSGQADIFQDGGVTVGTWQKTSNNAQITFTNAQGAPITLNAGQTWITAVGTAADISYK